MGFQIERFGSSYKGLSGGYRRLIDHAKGLSAIVTNRGGRLISLAFQGVELIDSKPEKFLGAENLLAMERGRVTWDQVGIGGARTWVAPQSEFGEGVFFLDLDLGRYAIRQQGASLVMTSPVCRETNLRVSRRLQSTLGGFRLSSQVTNISTTARRASPWDIFQTPVPLSIRIGPLVSPPELLSFDNPLGIEGFVEVAGESEYVLHFKDGINLPMFKLGFHFDFIKKGQGTISAVYSANGRGEVQLTEHFKLCRGPFPHLGQAEIFYNPFGRYVELEVLGRTQELRAGQRSARLDLGFTVLKSVKEFWMPVPVTFDAVMKFSQTLFICWAVSKVIRSLEACLSQQLFHSTAIIFPNITQLSKMIMSLGCATGKIELLPKEGNRQVMRCG